MPEYLISLLIGQSVTFGIIMIVLSLLQIGSANSISIIKNLPDKPRIFVSWLWFLLVSGSLVYFSGKYTTNFLLPYFGKMYIIQLPNPISQFLENPSLTLFTATVLSLTVAAFIYAPPEHRNLSKPSFIVTIRLLLFVGTIVLAGWVYQFYIISENFVFVAISAISLAIVLVFVQRSIS